jgi:hypothetical protein
LEYMLLILKNRFIEARWWLRIYIMNFGIYCGRVIRSMK